MSPTLLFVHSPIVGPSTWKQTADILRDRGYRCAVPDLRVGLATGPPFYPALAAAAAAAVSGGDSVMLVGHSAAGALLPAIADRVPAPARAVFVDAQLPHPGRSWFDTAPAPLCAQLRTLADAGLLPPYHEWFPPGVLEESVPDASLRREFVAELPRVPLAYFDEAAPESAWPGGRAAYLRLSRAYDDAAGAARRLGWAVVHRDWDHLRMLSAPDAVADLIAETVTRLDAGK